MKKTKMSAKEFIKNKLNEKTGQEITLYEHYLAHDTTISIGTALEWIEEFSHKSPREPDSKSAEEWLKAKYHTNHISPDIKMSKKYLIENMQEYAELYASQGVNLKEGMVKLILDFINGKFNMILHTTASKKEASEKIVDEYLNSLTDKK